MKTGKDGSFTLRIKRKEVKGPGVLDLLALSKGYRPEWKKGVPLENVPERVVFVLLRGETISGKIHSISGKPIAGLTVLACACSFTGRGKTFVDSFDIERNFPSCPSLWRKGYRQGSAVTDEDGRFLIQGLEKGTYSLFLKSYRGILGPLVQVEAGSKDVEGVAKRAVFVEAKVLDEETGKPVETFPVHLSIRNPVAESSIDLGAECRWGVLKVGWIPQWRLSRLPLPVKVTSFSPDYLQYETTLFFREAATGPPPTIFLKPVHRVAVSFRATYPGGSPLEYPILEVDYWKTGKFSPKGRVEARLAGNGLYQVRIPKGNDTVRVFRPNMTIQWPRKSWPRMEWSVPGKGPFHVVFAGGGLVRLHLSKETLEALRRGIYVLVVQWCRKQDKWDHGCRLSSKAKKAKNGTLVLKDVPPGIFLRFGLFKGRWEEKLVRATPGFWVDEGGELDFFL